ncbi:MAG: LPS assembly lipoprotein LptE [Sulfitobacter sp.]|uniref:LPS assembly lipoprotein LptE n=1 Tax=Sulfitobacter sp. TaxID=1903071 RepID=UPI003296D77B
MQTLRAGKFFAILVMMVGLAACGFTPVYGTGSETGRILSDIHVTAPNNREEYLLVRNLEEQLGRNSSAEHVLRYNISLSQEGLGLTGANRAHVLGSVSYQLVSQGNGQVIASGLVDSFTAFYVKDQLSVAAQSDAIERLMKILADKLITDLSLKILM